MLKPWPLTYLGAAIFWYDLISKYLRFIYPTDDLGISSFPLNSASEIDGFWPYNDFMRAMFRGVLTALLGPFLSLIIGLASLRLLQIL